MDYLRKSLSRDSLLGLYSDEKRGRYVCRAVLQRLPETSQQIIIRLSCTGGEFSLSMIRIWLKGIDVDGKGGGPMSRLLTRQLNEMYHWAIVTEKQQQPSNNNTTSNSTEGTITPDTIIKLTPEFYKGLKDSLHSLDASPWNALTGDQMEYLEQEANKDNNTSSLMKFPAMSQEDLERYTQSQWDAVLHYLVGTPNMKVQPNPAVTHFLFQTDLMQPDPDYKRSYNKDDAPLVITQKGYDFMLQDNSQQVWHFIVQYLDSMEASEKKDKFQREALLVLICLSFSRFGECYSTASLTKRGLKVVRDLALFGLIYYKEIGGTSIFYPTRIAMQLVGAGGAGGSNSGGGGGGSKGSGMWSWSTKALDEALSHPRPHNSSHLAIIVQTNFQLCAYTTSELHVSMLGLFCDVHSIRRLPNVIFMTITRDSIKGAFSLGIQSQQILRFLEKHAHPKLRQGSGGLGASVSASPLPGNIVDQICLWDRERSRVIWNDVFMHQPMLTGEFRAVHKYISDHGYHVWSSERRNQIYIKYDHVERVQKFIAKWRAKAASARR
jgi:transcription initiation factor TFIIH subunit 4